ncbi:MAG: extracellular solute-binding protein [Saprospiraceae bacterium]|nr:extracellular solute-binding protein [Saprospiraceae bacterium]MDZ4702993.1 extracellular solute-binding protein [Saprospiraceae bacterium]
MFVTLQPEKFRWSILALFFIALIGCTPRSKEETTAGDPPVSPEQTLTVYTFRNYPNDQHLFRLFEQRSGFKVNVVKGTGEELSQKLLTEGNSCPASLVILPELSLILQLKQKGALQQGQFGKLNLTIPSRYSDPEEFWIGLSKWTPAFAYSINKVNQQLIGRYVDLANPKWKDKVLTTKGTNLMNQTLVASMVAVEGPEATKNWLTGLVANMAEPPLDNDAAVIQAIAQGKGDIGLINASSFIQYQRSGSAEAFKQTEGIGLLYPVSASGGSTYFNLTVAGIPAHAPKPAIALKLLEFMIDQEVQKLFAETLYEFPLNPYSVPNDFLIELGGFKEKEVKFELIGQHLEQAKELLQASSWK